ncbi:hypothetical protein [Caballeronia sp. GAFFF2]|uniref:hypothetical protein n=2 Tax=unclassified Caballeronia TaxID=2646786 RepID=UPI0020295EC9|nr:hypothetical protein [Caballeronia sp. GAFFF2]
MSWRAYALEDLSHSNFGWMPMFDEARELARKENSPEIGVLEIEYQWALDTARAAGWSGDFKQRPRIFSLPERDELRFGLVWTQPKTANTPERAFVISPIDLPWLGEPDATLD